MEETGGVLNHSFLRIFHGKHCVNFKESCGFLHTPQYCEDFHAGVETVCSQRLLSLLSLKVNLFKFKMYDSI